MAKEFQARDIFSLGPKFRISTNGIAPGQDGTSVYAMYTVTNNNDVNLMGMNESGNFRILNDKSIEIVAGNKNSEKGVDVTIVGMNGDVTITAMSNGSIRIKGKNVMIEAIEDIDLKAGRNITASCGSGRILMKANKIDQDGLSGNVVERNFTNQCFEKSPVGKLAIRDLQLDEAPTIGS